MEVGAEIEVTEDGALEELPLHLVWGEGWEEECRRFLPLSWESVSLYLKRFSYLQLVGGEFAFAVVQEDDTPLWAISPLLLQPCKPAPSPPRG